MRDDLEEALYADFPTLYRGMSYGFEVGDGWEPLIRRLSEKLEPLAAVLDDCRTMQCKEKFGGLRYYMDNATNKMYQLIDVAEAESTKTCEVCGAPGSAVGKTWLKTACKDHE